MKTRHEVAVTLEQFLDSGGLFFFSKQMTTFSF